MPLSWNVIRSRAIQFSRGFENEVREAAEAKSFWDGFFNVFGISRRKVATFEQPVRRLDDSTGFIDLLWKGALLVEHKSRGKDLEKAYHQALDYFPGLADYELPKFILVSDFARFRLYDLEEGSQYEFNLPDFHKNIKHFGFIAGYQKHVFREEDPVNIHAAEMMGKLHDRLKEAGYEGHSLEVYLVRLLFCLFAEDSSIFEPDQFHDFIVNNTREDGSDLGSQLSSLFFILNTPQDKRLRTLDEALGAFPYVNGKLFEETLPHTFFESRMRTMLLEYSNLNWGKISPAIFGSLFQSVMNQEERRNLGAHYTSEKNILKLIKPLFLDDLLKEFEKVKTNRGALIRYHEKIASLRFLDPACGCGNFLVITYRELRLLELEIIRILEKGQQVLDIRELLKIDVDRFYGIEIEEFPSQIAQVALWLMDHQMNMLVSEAFGEYFVRLPLRKSANIVHGNALLTDWQSLIDPIPWEKKEQRFDYIFGNPPFVGKQHQNFEQKAEMEFIFHGVHGAGVLDFVTAWYIKAAGYMQSTQSSIPDQLQFEPVKTKAAFVSTNSIAQGEQVGILWNELFNRFYIKFHFAHRTFKWSNEARGKAAVHVVIIGFSNFDIPEKRIFEYEDIKGEPHEIPVKNINPFLVAGSDIYLTSKRQPICQVPSISFGSMPNDDGNLLLDDSEKKELLRQEPGSEKFIKPFISAREFLISKSRWCLWLLDADPGELKKLPEILKRIQKVQDFRLSSNREATRKLASFPALFGEIRQPKSSYVLIPLHSSETRKYIPFGFLSEDNIIGNTCSSIPNANLYHFGVITSEMHHIWIKYVCGRIKSDYRYSNDIVYNNFPWPENPSKKQIKTVENAASNVLEVREKYLNPKNFSDSTLTDNSGDFATLPPRCPSASLADLYDPLTMPPELVRAHQELDKAVDLCYRPKPFPSETKRIEFLFELYDKYTAGLFATMKKRH